MTVQERNNPDQELQRLRALFGDQGALFNAFAGEARRGDANVQRRLPAQCSALRSDWWQS